MAQSLSICVPAKGHCINNCKTCCSMMHPSEYPNMYHGTLMDYAHYMEDLKERMEYAREKGCDVCMLTGSTEPQQDKQFLRDFWLINQSLERPYRDIEIQTTGAFMDDDMLEFLAHKVGVKTICISTFNIFSETRNREIMQTKDSSLGVRRLCESAKKYGMNIRLCLNITDEYAYPDGKITSDIIDGIFDRCAYLKADQITIRKMWAPDNTSKQGKWIESNCKCSDKLITMLEDEIVQNGAYLNTLEYGAKRYAYKGFSTVIDRDSMAQDKNNQAIKYYVIRQNGKLYSNWDSPASLIF